MSEEKTQIPTPEYRHINIELEDTPDFSKYKRAYGFLNKNRFVPISSKFRTSAYVWADGTGIELKSTTELFSSLKVNFAIALPQGSKFLEELIAEFPETEKQIRR